MKKNLFTKFFGVILFILLISGNSYGEVKKVYCVKEPAYDHPFDEISFMIDAEQKTLKSFWKKTGSAGETKGPFEIVKLTDKKLIYKGNEFAGSNHSLYQFNYGEDGIYLVLEPDPFIMFQCTASPGYKVDKDQKAEEEKKKLAEQQKAEEENKKQEEQKLAEQRKAEGVLKIWCIKEPDPNRDSWDEVFFLIDREQKTIESYWKPTGKAAWTNLFEIVKITYKTVIYKFTYNDGSTIKFQFNYGGDGKISRLGPDSHIIWVCNPSAYD